MEIESYLDRLIQAGRGIVVFGLTEDGTVGLYCEGFKDGRVPLGVGDDAEDAIDDARRKDLMGVSDG